MGLSEGGWSWSLEGATGDGQPATSTSDCQSAIGDGQPATIDGQPATSTSDCQPATAGSRDVQREGGGEGQVETCEVNGKSLTRIIKIGDAGPGQPRAALAQQTATGVSGAGAAEAKPATSDACAA